jgi:hypothetical protein
MVLALVLKILLIIEAAHATHPMERVLKIKDIVHLIQIMCLVHIQQSLVHIQQEALVQYL